MSDAVAIFLFVFTCMGATILIVWPAGGPTAWVRDQVLRRILTGKLGHVLDCYICLGTWVGLIAAPFWWRAGYRWSSISWLMLPAAFWLALPESRIGK